MEVIEGIKSERLFAAEDGNPSEILQTYSNIREFPHSGTPSFSFMNLFILVVNQWQCHGQRIVKKVQ